MNLKNTNILTGENLDVSKDTKESQTTITKEPVTETKTVQVPITHEEVTIETRPPSEQTEAQTPVSFYREYNNTYKKRRS